MDNVASSAPPFPGWPAWAIEHEEDLEAYVGVEPEMDGSQAVWALGCMGGQDGCLAAA